MQEIEVIEKDGVTTTSLSSTSYDAPPPIPSCHAAMEVLFTMLSKEEMMPLLDIQSTICDDNVVLEAPITSDPSYDPISISDRTKMCSWFYEMSTFLKISPSTASRAMFILDRFMTSTSPTAEMAKQQRDEYQLAALTALFLSIKLYERLNILPSHVSALSRGRYFSEEVIAMELVLLKGLKWKVLQSMKLDYADLILECIIPKLSCFHCTASDQQDVILSEIRHLTNLQLQLSDFYISYSTLRQPMLALAAVMNTYEAKKAKLPLCDRTVFHSTISELMCFYSSEDICKIQLSLQQLIDPCSASTTTTDDGFSYNAAAVSHPTADNHPSLITSSSSTDLTNSCQEMSHESFEAAFDTMQEMHLNIMSHFLCCGSIPVTTAQKMDMESNATQSSTALHNTTFKNNSSCNSHSPGILEKTHSNDSQRSIKWSINRKYTPRPIATEMTTSDTKPSPTTITTIFLEWD